MYIFKVTSFFLQVSHIWKHNSHTRHRKGDLPFWPVEGVLLLGSFQIVKRVFVFVLNEHFASEGIRYILNIGLLPL